MLARSENMAKVQVLKSLVEQRLKAAVDEIFSLFEGTIEEYEEELRRSEQEKERQRKLLEAVLKPRVVLHRADVQQLLVKRDEDPPEQQEGSCSLDQEDPPQSPHIKVEQEEQLWTSQEGEQLQGPENADGSSFTFTSVPVKTEDDEGCPQSSQLHQSHTEESKEAEPPASSSAQHMETETNVEDCGGPGPDRSPDGHVPPDTSTSSLRNTNPCPPYVNKNLFACSHCGRKFKQNSKLKVHMICHSGEKPFSCYICSKRFTYKQSCTRHMMFHSGEKPFRCSVCEKHYARRDYLIIHMRIHAREKPCICSVCGKDFLNEQSLSKHMCIHMREKPFSCNVCEKKFLRQSSLRGHACVPDVDSSKADG